MVNFIPARITALIIVAAAWLCKKNAGLAWHIMLRDSRKTESPNAGLSMSAIAGALDIQLEKAGQYTLGNEHSPLSTGTLDASVHVITTAAALWTGLLIISQVVYYALS